MTGEEEKETGAEGAGLVLTITNRRGLHARASAKFVKVAAEFDAQVEVSKDGMSVCGTSIMGLMMLAAAAGDQIEVSAEGPERGPALAALRQLVEAKFDEN